MIIVSGGTKGGSGKSTVAANLAVIRAAEGRDVLLVDADEQETATDFTNLRKEGQGSGEISGPSYTCIKLTGAAVRTEILRLAPKHQDIIIDTGGRDTTSQRAALTVANVLLVPFVPRSFDLWTLETVAALVDEMKAGNPKLRAYTFLNKADPRPRGTDNDDTAKELRDSKSLQFLDIPLGLRKAFSNAAAHGLAVTEHRPADPKAVEEIMALHRYVFDIGKISSRNQKKRA